MSIKEKIEDSLFFKTLRDSDQEAIKDKERALGIIRRVANTHLHTPSMADYKFFLREMEIALWAVDYWQEDYDTLNKEDEKLFDYVDNKVRAIVG